MRISAGAALAALIALPALPLAAQEGEDLPIVIKARQGQMYEYAFHLGQFGAMAKGEMPYDADLAQRLADQLATLTSIEYVGYWPEGTSTEEYPASRALPAIWENLPDFEEKQANLNQAVDTFATQAGQGQEALAAAMQGLGGACGACHENYRESE